ncbi:MAG: CotH kinase family protein [Ruminococcus sp.]|nr:CotH kinase family protein [Ruminococcus sp.]
MKKYISALTAALLLTGCAKPAQLPEQTAIQTTTDISAVSSASSETVTAQGGLPDITGTQVMPVVSITSESGSNDFASKPMNGYVSSLIASWTPGFDMPPEPYYENCTVVMADTDGSIITDAPAQVKVRGNWTTSYEKKPLRIKFNEKQPMGISGGDKDKNWVLLSEYKDLSFLRNKAALMMAGEILGADGYYTSDSELVEVYINGEYWGVYLLGEQPQTGKSRVDITEPEKGYEGTDIGYLLEMDGNFFLEEPLEQFHISYNDNAPLIPYDGNGGSGRTISCLSDDTSVRNDIGFTIKSDIYSQAQHDFIAKYTEGVYNIMYSAAYENKAYVFDENYDLTESDISPEEAVRAVVDVDSLADMYIVSELTCDADIYWSSFYMSADFGEGGSGRLTFGLPWDFDSGLGNKDRCADGTGFYAANVVPDVNANAYETCNPWLTVLMYQDWFTDIIRDKWTRAYDSGIFERTLGMIDSETENCREAFERNNTRWDTELQKWTIIGELSSRAANCTDQKQAADWLYEWLEQRVLFLNEQWHR